MVQYVHFDPIRSNLVHYVHFGPNLSICSILSTLSFTTPTPLSHLTTTAGIITSFWQGLFLFSHSNLGHVSITWTMNVFQVRCSPLIWHWIQSQGIKWFFQDKVMHISYDRINKPASHKRIYPKMKHIITIDVINLNFNNRTNVHNPYFQCLKRIKIYVVQINKHQLLLSVYQSLCNHNNFDHNDRE